MKRRRFDQTTPSDEHLEEQATRLRKEAQGTPPGVEREKLIRQARKPKLPLAYRNGFRLPAACSHPNRAPCRDPKQTSNY